MCPSSTTCHNMECERRHPRLCRVFARFRHYKFKECAYLHVQDGNITHIDELGKEIVELKENVKDLSKLVKSLNERERRMDIEVKILKESLVNMTKTCEELRVETKKIIKEMDNKVLHNPKTNITDSEFQSKKKTELLHQFNECDYTASKEITMKEHFNSKHYNTVNCQKCELLDNHINEHHNNKSSFIKETPKVSEPDNHECSLCEDEFSTREDYDEHMNEHIQEINQIDIETLKSSHDIFECNFVISCRVILPLLRIT